MATVSERPGSAVQGLRAPRLGRPAQAALILVVLGVLHLLLDGDFPGPPA